MVQQHQALLKQQSELLAAAELALKLAQQAGAQAQVGASKSSGLSVSTRLQQVENIEFNNDGALGISVYLGQRKGNASTSDLSPSAVKSAVEAALSIAKYTSEDPYNGLPEQDLLEFAQFLINEVLAKSDASQKSVFNLDEAAQFCEITIKTIYKKTSKGEIPHYKQAGKLFFKRVDLEAWLTEKKGYYKPDI